MKTSYMQKIRSVSDGEKVKDCKLWSICLLCPQGYVRFYLHCRHPPFCLRGHGWARKWKKKNCDAGIKQRVVFILGRCEKTSQEISNNTALQWGQKQRRQYWQTSVLLIFYKTKYIPLCYGTIEEKMLKFPVEHNWYSQSNAMAMQLIENNSCVKRVMLVFSFEC